MLAHLRIPALAVAMFAMAATACASVPEGSVEAAAVPCPEGSDCYDVPRAVGEGGTLTVDAGDFFFENLQGTFWAGDVEVTIDNVADSTEHNIFFIGANEGSEQPVQAQGGEQATGVVNLFEGEYTFYCTIPGHRANGMEGTLTVHATQEEAEEELTEAPTDAVGTEGATEAGTETDEPTEAATEG